MCSNAMSVKRASFVIRRVYFCVDLGDRYDYRHCPTRRLPADALNKHLPVADQLRFYAYLGIW